MNNIDRDKAHEVVAGLNLKRVNGGSLLKEPWKLEDVIATALAEVRRETWDAARRKHLLIIQSLPATATGAGAFKASAIAALESAKEKKGGRHE